MLLYSHEIKPDLCLLISFLHCDHFYNWSYNLIYSFCSTLLQLNDNNIVVKLKMAFTAIRSDPNFCSKKIPV